MIKITGHHARLLGISLFFVLILFTLVWRIYDLTVSERPFLREQGNARSIRVIEIPAYRGMITDRNGAPLAVSTIVKSLWINPKLFVLNKKQLQELANLLQLPKQSLVKRIKSMHGHEFVYIRRHLSPELTKKIEDLHIPGVNFQSESKRYYPEAESMAQLIGFTNIDDHGIEGMELAYESWLNGVSGQKKVVKDRAGNIIEELNIIKQPVPGNDLQLSVDRRIQFFAYKELQNTVVKFGAKSGSVVVLDAHTGEALAVANYPSYNPNLREHYTVDNYRNKAITDAFEPGSVMKPFSIASALSTGLFSPKTIIDTRPSYMTVHGRTVRDIHNYGVLDVTGVLQHSSNVGVTKMLLASPADQFYSLLLKCGIGLRTETNFPGESDGSIVQFRAVNPFVLATLGFGYGMSVTMLQLAKSYLIFANQGRLIPVSLLHNQPKGEGVQVLNPKVADQLLTMLEEVVSGEGGTGKPASVPGYRVAGKTGTAKIAEKHGYAAHRYIASFVGIAPVSNPKLVVAVAIHEPTQHGYYANLIAAPLFSSITSMALRMLDIPPDEEYAAK